VRNGGEEEGGIVKEIRRGEERRGKKK
jgi:hypothetical protein